MVGQFNVFFPTSRKIQSLLTLPISIMKPTFLNAHLLIQQQQPDFFFRNHHQPKTMDVIKVNLQMN